MHGPCYFVVFGVAPIGDINEYMIDAIHSWNYGFLASL